MTGQSPPRYPTLSDKDNYVLRAFVGGTRQLDNADVAARCGFRRVRVSLRKYVICLFFRPQVGVQNDLQPNTDRALALYGSYPWTTSTTKSARSRVARGNCPPQALADPSVNLSIHKALRVRRSSKEKSHCANNRTVPVSLISLISGRVSSPFGVSEYLGRSASKRSRWNPGTPFASGGYDQHGIKLPASCLAMFRGAASPALAIG